MLTGDYLSSNKDLLCQSVMFTWNIIWRGKKFMNIKYLWTENVGILMACLESWFSMACSFVYVHKHSFNMLYANMSLLCTQIYFSNIYVCSFLHFSPLFMLDSFQWKYMCDKDLITRYKSFKRVIKQVLWSFHLIYIYRESIRQTFVSRRVHVILKCGSGKGKPFE